MKIENIDYLDEQQVYLSKDGQIFEKNESEIKRVNTDQVLSKLNYQIILEDGFTLRSYFRLIKNYYWSIKFLDNFFDCYLEEFGQCSSSNCFIEEIDYLVLKRYTSFEAEKTIYSDFSDNEPINFPSFIETEIEFLGWSEKENMPYGIDFFHLNELLDYEIKFGNSKVSIELTGNIEDYENLSDKFVYREATDASGYTLFQFIIEIIQELSIFGCKDQKEEHIEELDRRSEEMRNWR